MEALPYRCPLLQGDENKGAAKCVITGEDYKRPYGRCWDILYSYLSCEHFSKWFWERRKRRVEKQLKLSKKEVTHGRTS